MFDAQNNLIAVGDMVVVGSTGNTAARLLFARVKSIGKKRVTLERIEGHPRTLGSWQVRSTREFRDVLVVKS